MNSIPKGGTYYFNTYAAGSNLYGSGVVTPVLVDYNYLKWLRFEVVPLEERNTALPDNVSIRVYTHGYIRFRHIDPDEAYPFPALELRQHGLIASAVLVFKDYDRDINWFLCRRSFRKDTGPRRQNSLDTREKAIEHICGFWLDRQYRIPWLIHSARIPRIYDLLYLESIERMLLNIGED